MSMVDRDHDQHDSASEQTETKPGRGFLSLFRKKGSEPDDVKAVLQASRSSTQVGQLLWETRQDKKITLEQVEGVTRIRAKYVAALESGEYDKLPTPGHVHGFLRSYATFLGLDWEEVRAMHTQERPSRHFDPGIFHPKNIVLSPRRFGLKTDLVLGLVIALIVGVIGFWAFWEYGRPLLYGDSSATPTSEASTVGITVVPTMVVQTRAVKTATSTSETATPTSETATPVPETATATRPLITVTPKATRTPMPVATATKILPTPTATLNAPLNAATPTSLPNETATPALTEGVTLAIEIVERAWLQVTLDGENQPSGILEVGETREWNANFAIYIICGNAGGVNVTVNGKDLGLLGERAAVVEKMWGPQGEITPTPGAEEEEPGAGTATPVVELTLTVEPTPTPSE